jgi:hypothetical protein
VVVCVVGVKSRGGDDKQQSWGLGPGGKVGWEGWLEGGVLLLVAGPGFWLLVSVVSVLVLVPVDFLSPLVGVVSAGCCKRSYV